MAAWAPDHRVALTDDTTVLGTRRRARRFPEKKSRTWSLVHAELSEGRRDVGVQGEGVVWVVLGLEGDESAELLFAE